MENLHIDPSKVPQNKKTSKTAHQVEVVDSWEDEDVESGAETPVEAPGPSLKQVASNDLPPGPPPPTPISPPQSNLYDDWSSSSLLGSRPAYLRGSEPGTPKSDSDSERKRPEKTTAAAGRMIAASLGMKAPKKTEEQRQYDRAMREQEMKRRNREKEGRERERIAEEKVKAAVWDS